MSIHASGMDHLLVYDKLQVNAEKKHETLKKSDLTSILDIEDDAAFAYAQAAARQEGLLVGISTGAVLAAVAGLLPTLPKASRVLALNFDTGERYLSVPGFVKTNA